MSDKLGTLEFSCALNGDNHDQIFDVLKRFVKTVKQERYQAFSTDDHSSGSDGTASDFDSDSDDEVLKEGRASKRNKVEAWKLDTNSYNVPFVGTSTHKGTSGSVNTNTWPTGFLEAYLNLSPQAMELLGPEFQKTMAKTNGNIGKLRCLFLSAVGEVVSCAIPLNKIDDMENRTDLERVKASEIANEVTERHQNIVSLVMKDHHRDLLSVLNEHAFSDSRQNLLLSVLTVLRYLASTSVGTAREIVRDIDSHIKDGVLHKLASYKYSTRKYKKKDGAVDNGDAEKGRRRQRLALKVQTATLELATILLEYNDATIMSYISSSGGKESKSKSGLLYLVLRASLSQGSTFFEKGASINAFGSVEEAYQLSLFHFLRMIRTNLLRAEVDVKKGSLSRIRPALSNRALVELFRGALLEQMIGIFNAPLNSDDDGDETYLPEIKEQCNEIIKSLLSDVERSPLLIQLVPERNKDSAFTAILHQINKALQLMLSANPNVDTRDFVAKCFKATPALFPNWLRTLTVPEPKASFACLSIFSLIGAMLKNGPDVNMKDFQKLKEGDKKKAYDVLIANVVPRALTKNVLTKALQTSNPFMATETLNLLSVVLHRFKNFATTAFAGNDQKLQYLTEKLAMRMPDLQVILALRSKFDPFAGGKSDGQGNQSFSQNSFVAMNICEVLQLYVSLFPTSIRTVPFDWVKLLSQSSETVLSAPMSLQCRLLSTILAIQDCFERVAVYSNSLYSSKAYRVLVSILLETNNTFIYNLVRRLVIKLISNIIHTSGVKKMEANHQIQYEISLWVDGTTPATAVMVGKLLEAVRKVTVQHATVVSNAWRNHFNFEDMPPVMFSPLLSFALISIASNIDAFPGEFVTTVHNICMKCLVSAPDARVLACLLRFLFHSQVENGTCSKNVEELYRYASTLLDNEDLGVQGTKIYTSFGEHHFHSILAHFAQSGKNTGAICEKLNGVLLKCEEMHKVAATILSQCVHHLHRNGSQQLYKVMKMIVPYILQAENNVDTFKSIIELPLSFNSCTMMLVMLTFSLDNTQCSRDNVMCNNILPKLEATLQVDLKQEKGDVPKQAILMMAGASNLFSSKEMGSTAGSLCRICSNTRFDEEFLRPYFALLMKVCDVLLSKDPAKEQLIKLDIEAVFKLWFILSRKDVTDSDRFLGKQLRRSLENLMSVVLMNSETYCLQSALLIKGIQVKSADIVAQLAFSNLKQSNTDDYSTNNFIESLLVYDSSMFSSSIIKCIAFEEKVTGEIRHENKILATIVQQTHSQRHCADKKSEWYQNIVGIVVATFCLTLKQMVKDQEDKKLFLGAFGAVSILAQHGRLNEEQSSEIMEALSALLQRWKVMKWKDVPKQSEKTVLSFISTLCKSCPNATRSDPMFTSMCNLTLSYMVKMLPRSFKSKLSTVQSSVAMLTVALDLLRISDVSNISCLQEMLILCLKFGVGALGDNLSSFCLEIVRFIITSVYAGKTPESHIKMFTPIQIHSMVLSHSNFDNLAMSSSHEARIELLSLLISCVALSQDTIKPDKEKTMKLLGAFHASTSKEDHLLRRLLALYEKGSSQDEILFMHIVVQGYCHDAQDEAQIVPGSDHAHHWESFIEGLDSRRIRRTIDDFPLCDPVQPTVISDVEVWLQNNHVSNEGSDDGTGPALSSEDSIDEIMSNNSSVDVTPGKGPRIIIVEESQYLDSDGRYSPGFIIPLVLGVLEAFGELAESEEEPFCSINETDIGGKRRSFAAADDDEHSSPNRETLTKIAYRLFQKGAIAFSVACLSSKCPKLRTIAIAVIYRFLQALHMKEAQKVAQWRSRPQVEMLICSLQRGLMVSRAQRIMTKANEDNEHMMVPMLPAVSALFLARSLQILAKPADDLYGCINKSFLRLNSNHGAYTDCFSLPAFMTLFCSVNENTDQAKKERLWALHLLKDGTVDAYSYRMASRRHVPELLLTTFDALCSSVNKSNENEILLLAEAIQTLIERGNSSSFHHYVQAVGILSWAQSTLEMSILDSPVKTTKIMKGFSELLRCILKKTVEYDHTKESEEQINLQFNALKLARGVSQLFKYITIDDNEKEPCDRIMPQTIITFSEIYHFLYQIQDKSRNDFATTCSSHPYGLQLDTCVEIILATKQFAPTLIHRTIASLSSLPFESNLSQKQKSVLEFCEEAITALATENVPCFTDTRLISNILKRIAKLHSSHSFNKNAPSIMQSLFGCRRIVVTKYGCSTEWLECLKALAAGLPSNDKQHNLSTASTFEHCVDYAELVDVFAINVDV